MIYMSPNRFRIPRVPVIILPRPLMLNNKIIWVLNYEKKIYLKGLKW